MLVVETSGGFIRTCKVVRTGGFVRFIRLYGREEGRRNALILFIFDCIFANGVELTKVDLHICNCIFANEQAIGQISGQLPTPKRALWPV